jgi:hypothetical protein
VFGEAFFLRGGAVCGSRLLGEANPLSVMPAAALCMWFRPLLVHWAVYCLASHIARRCAAALGLRVVDRGACLFYFSSGADFPFGVCNHCQLRLYGLAQAWLASPMNNRDQVDHRLAVSRI